MCREAAIDVDYRTSNTYALVGRQECSHLSEVLHRGPPSEHRGLALLAGWAGLSRRPALCIALAGAALLGKEDQAWNVLVVGLAIADAGEARRLGTWLAGGAFAYGLLVVGVLMPVVRAGRAVDTASYYAWLAHATPGAVLHALLAPTGWVALLVMLACAGGLPLLRPRWLALALPPFVADLLSAHSAQPALHLHYALPIVVPLLVAAGKGAAAVSSARGAALFAVPPVLAALALGSLPPALAANPAPFKRPAALNRLLSCAQAVPPDAPLAADDPLLPALASRPAVSELTKAGTSDYVVIDRSAWLPGYVVRSERDRAVAAAAGRTVLCDDGRFLVLGPGA